MPIKKKSTSTVQKSTVISRTVDRWRSSTVKCHMSEQGARRSYVILCTFLHNKKNYHFSAALWCAIKNRSYTRTYSVQELDLISIFQGRMRTKRWLPYVFYFFVYNWKNFALFSEHPLINYHFVLAPWQLLIEKIITKQTLVEKSLEEIVTITISQSTFPEQMSLYLFEKKS